MNVRSTLCMPIAACLALSLTAPLVVNATPVVTYNDNVTAILGSGNPNIGWVTAADNGLELSLRGKNRVTGATTNDGAGTYLFPTGTAPSSTRALWNMEWSINTGTATLDQYTFKLSFDTDPTAGTSWTTVNPLTYFTDNSYGTASTANGAGVEGLSSLFVSTNTTAQNSFNLTFAPVAGNPNIDATYGFKLEAFDRSGALADADTMSVKIGAGGAPVPSVPDSGSTLGFVALAFAGLAGCRRLFG